MAPGPASRDIGRRVGAARVLGRLSFDELAERANLSVGGIRKIETGERAPADETVEAIAAACELPIGFFVIDWSTLDDPTAAFARRLNEIAVRLSRIEASIHDR